MRTSACLCLLICLVSALSACSSSKFAYNRLDWLAGWELRKFVDLDADQQARYDRDFNAFWQWHRREELPSYAADLRDLKGLTHGANPRALAQLGKQAEQSWNRIVDHLAPSWCANLASLKNTQVASIAEELDERIDQINEDFIQAPQEQVRRESLKRIIKRLKPWWGPVNQQQAESIERWSRERPLDYDHWLAQRIRWRDQFIAQLNRRSEPGFCSGVTQLFKRNAETAERGFPMRNDASRDAWNVFMARLINQMDERQKAHFETKLEELAANLETLSAQ